MSLGRAPSMVPAGVRAARFRAVAAAVVAVVALVAAGCTDDAAWPPEEAGDEVAAERSAVGDAADDCRAPQLARPVEARPAGADGRDLDLVSFDDTPIRLHWFPRPGAGADDPAPIVLMGPGWSLPGQTDPDGPALFGSLSISALHDAGYNVLTWDPRGFGASGGTAQVNDPGVEGRDMQHLLEWVAEQPEVLLDGDARPPCRDGRRVLRRRDPAGHRGDRLSGRCDRSDPRLALARHEPVPQRDRQARLGRRARRRGHRQCGRPGRDPVLRGRCHVGPAQRRGPRAGTSAAGPPSSSNGSPPPRCSSRERSTRCSPSRRPSRTTRSWSPTGCRCP